MISSNNFEKLSVQLKEIVANKLFVNIFLAVLPSTHCSYSSIAPTEFFFVKYENKSANSPGCDGITYKITQ